MPHDIPPQIAADLNAHLYLKTRLQEDFPDIDDETLQDTLEGLTTLNEDLAAVLRSRVEDEILITGLKVRLEDMRARLQRLQERSDKKRELVADVMTRAGMQRLTLPDLTVSTRKTPAPIEIVDEVAIPATYWRQQPPTLDRMALGNALKAGAFVAGARLGMPGSSITIRTR
ncbi:MAG: siphovirus Gp157 family protein [Parvibaculaceae bacterium]